MQYGLIGEHLGHSYSCEIHNNIGNYKYELMELRPDELHDFLIKKDFCGINVTIPYKQTVIKYLDEISPMAKHIGAVNTIVNRNGKLYGYNTDYDGMKAQLMHMGAKLQGKKVLILGTGGTSKTAYAVAQRLGAKCILFVSRSGKDGSISYTETIKFHSDAQFIINTTPVGMYPNTNASPIDISCFSSLEGILDAIYNPIRTNLILDARKRNLICEGGLYMLSAQAVYASALFQDIDVDLDQVDKAYNSVSLQKQNIVILANKIDNYKDIAKYLSHKFNKKLCIMNYSELNRSDNLIGDIFNNGDHVIMLSNANYADKAFIKLARSNSTLVSFCENDENCDITISKKYSPEEIAEVIVKEIAK
ncbi:MAG: shikimate dehydrogenase [Clostridia bacterium]|nr:shikimate dehydrogenase [Clostridia bacterium]